MEVSFLVYAVCSVGLCLTSYLTGIAKGKELGQLEIISDLMEQAEAAKSKK